MTAKASSCSTATRQREKKKEGGGGPLCTSTRHPIAYAHTGFFHDRGWPGGGREVEGGGGGEGRDRGGTQNGPPVFLG